MKILKDIGRVIGLKLETVFTTREGKERKGLNKESKFFNIQVPNGYRIRQE